MLRTGCNKSSTLRLCGKKSELALLLYTSAALPFIAPPFLGIMAIVARCGIPAFPRAPLVSDWPPMTWLALLFIIFRGSAHDVVYRPIDVLMPLRRQGHMSSCMNVFFHVSMEVNHEFTHTPAFLCELCKLFQVVLSTVNTWGRAPEPRMLQRLQAPAG